MRIVAVVFVLVIVPASTRAAPAGAELQLRWIDVEGGASTLIVTPAGESVLIDAGSAGMRDAGRIVTAAQKMGLKRIDHVVVTHFHSDHFGGIPDLAAQIPLGTIYEHNPDSVPDQEKSDKKLVAYLAFKGPPRKRIAAGLVLPLQQRRGTPTLTVRFLGTEQNFGPAQGKTNPNCRDHVDQAPDPSDNRNSVVTLLTFGAFRYFNGGDLTWNTEVSVVCPQDRVGPVDVFQTNHHGLDISNNPVLVKTLNPTVAVVNNGPRKGGEPNTLATLKSLPRLAGLYQVHRNLRLSNGENADPAHVANADESCTGASIDMTVAPTGRKYTVTVASTGHKATYATAKR